MIIEILRGWEDSGLHRARPGPHIFDISGRLRPRRHRQRSPPSSGPSAPRASNGRGHPSRSRLAGHPSRRGCWLVPCQRSRLPPDEIDTSPRHLIAALEPMSSSTQSDPPGFERVGESFRAARLREISLRRSAFEADLSFPARSSSSATRHPRPGRRSIKLATPSSRTPRVPARRPDVPPRPAAPRRHLLGELKPGVAGLAIGGRTAFVVTSPGSKSNFRRSPAQAGADHSLLDCSSRVATVGSSRCWKLARRHASASCADLEAWQATSGRRARGGFPVPVSPPEAPLPRQNTAYTQAGTARLPPHQPRPQRWGCVAAYAYRLPE